MAKNEEKPTSTCFKPIFTADSGYPKIRFRVPDPSLAEQNAHKNMNLINDAKMGFFSNCKNCSFILFFSLKKWFIKHSRFTWAEKKLFKSFFQFIHSFIFEKLMKRPNLALDFTSSSWKAQTIKTIKKNSNLENFNFILISRHQTKQLFQCTFFPQISLLKIYISGNIFFKIFQNFLQFRNAFRISERIVKRCLFMIISILNFTYTQLYWSILRLFCLLSNLLVQLFLFWYLQAISTAGEYI